MKKEVKESEPKEDRPGFTRKMTRDEINDLPIHRYQGPIRVVRDERSFEEAVKRLRKEKVLGFDTETRPSFKKGQSYSPAVIQLAGARTVYLFQLKHVPLRDGLLKIFASKRIVKTGAAIGYDIQQLQELAPVVANRFVDLGDVARDHGIQNHGLRGLAAVLLGFRISKQAQRSNWGKAELTHKQIEYAATDAWVSRALYMRLKELGYL